MPALLPLLASARDLSDHTGEAITDKADRKRAEGALRSASNLVRRESGRQWLNTLNPAETDPHLPEDLWLVVMDAAARKYLNPEGFEQEREDNWYGARKVQEAGVYLTPTELATVESYNRPLHRGIGTVPTTRGDIPPSASPLDISDLYPARDW